MLSWLKSLFASLFSAGSTTAIQGGEQVIKAGIDLAAKLQDEHNTQAMLDAEAARQRQNRINAINEAIRLGDLDALRKLSSP